MAETDIAYCLTKVGQAAVDWRTLVVAGSGTCRASAAELWRCGATWSSGLPGRRSTGRRRSSTRWCGDKNGVRSCHVWRFEPMSGGGTRVHNVEVFAGTTIGLVKPVVGKRWNRLFQSSVDGVIAAAEAAGVRSHEH